MTPERSPQWQEIVRKFVVRRTLSGLSQRDVAARGGLHQALISDVELLKRIPSGEMLIRLAAAYGFKLTLEDAK